MNDKQQLAAMGEHMSEQAAQPMCMAKRIEDLEARVRGLVGLLREAKPYVKDCADWGRKHDADLCGRIEAAMAGNLPALHVPEGWQLVPKEITPHMGHSGEAALDDDGSMQAIWTDMLAAATKLEAK